MIAYHEPSKKGRGRKEGRKEGKKERREGGENIV
jgi:hypothetical protein